MKKRTFLRKLLVLMVVMCVFATLSIGADAVAFADEEEQEEVRETGLYLDGDDVLRYYENGVFSERTGLVKRLDTNTWHYVEGGIYRKATGLTACVQPGNSYGKSYYVKNGDLYKKTGTVTKGFSTVKLKKGRFVKFIVNKSALKKVKFRTLDKLGVKGYSQAFNSKIDKEMRKMITWLAQNGVDYKSLPAEGRAYYIGYYIGGTYYYNDGSYTAESMLKKGYGTCFAYSELTYLMLKKAGIKQVWLTVPGRCVNHSVKIGNATLSRMYGSRHRTVIARINKQYYDIDANSAFTAISVGKPEMYIVENISKSYAKYLIGKTKSFKSIN